MEDPQASSEIKGREGDEFYEEIEAPKFVDFTAPDRRPGDEDRYWFCLRVGCDQKHEEEMDSEAIYKNFVLRVMAARSPNVGLQKALHRKAPSKNMKCPLTAPAKTSKSRISRLAVISSFSQKMADAKVKTKHIPKPSTTPNAKAKESSVLAKALTTPRNKKCPSNLGDTFRSVRNLKATTVAVPKSRVVAKALVFHSPKKAVRMKSSSGLNSPVRNLCAGLKKLEITGGKKHASGRPFRVREVKSRVYDSLYSQNHKGQEAKSSRSQKIKSKGRELQQFRVPLIHEGNKNDLGDMEFDEKSRNGSLEMCSISGAPKNSEGNGEEDCLTIVIPLENIGPANSKQEEATLSSVSPVLVENSDALSGDMHSQSNSEDKDLGVSGDASEFHSPVEDRDQCNEGSDHVEKIKLNSETVTRKISVVMESDDKENASGSDDVENDKDSDDDKENAAGSDNKENGNEVMDSDDKENAAGSDYKENGNEVMDSDDKENATGSDNKQNDNEVVDNDDKENPSAFDDNRKLNVDDSNSQKKVLGKHKKTEKVASSPVSGSLRNPKLLQATREMGKSMKERPAITDPQGVKYRKPKPTNPKPFRLRTDERGILKEANLEKKLHLLAPSKEITGGNSQRNDQNTIQPSVGTICSKTSQGEVEQKFSTRTPQRHTVSTEQKANPVASQQEYSRNKTTEKLEDSFRKSKSPSVKQLARLQGFDRVASGKKGIVKLTTPTQLGVLKETSPTIRRLEESAMPGKYDTSQATKASPSTGSRSRGRRPATIPKEPNFHSIHVPKSCTRKLLP